MHRMIQIKPTLSLVISSHKLYLVKVEDAKLSIVSSAPLKSSADIKVVKIQLP